MGRWIAEHATSRLRRLPTILHFMSENARHGRSVVLELVVFVAQNWASIGSALGRSLVFNTGPMPLYFYLKMFINYFNTAFWMIQRAYFFESASFSRNIFFSQILKITRFLIINHIFGMWWGRCDLNVILFEMLELMRHPLTLHICYIIFT